MLGMARAYGKAGNGNETETGNGISKWKLEMETGNGNWKRKLEQNTHKLLVQRVCLVITLVFYLATVIGLAL